MAKHATSPLPAETPEGAAAPAGEHPERTDPAPLAVVTGASTGIGRATALHLARAGWRVIATARRGDRLASITDESGIETIVADITDADDVARLADAAKTAGGASALVNIAGGARGTDRVESADLDDWRFMFEVNVLGTQRMIAALLPQLRASAADGLPADIVTLTSTASLVAYEGGAGYNAAKFAEHAIVQALRLELNGEPVRVIEIAPGMVHTEEFSLRRLHGDREVADRVYEGVDSPLTADDVAEVIVGAMRLPRHVNVDQLVLRPLAQAAQHKLHRGPIFTAAAPEASSSTMGEPR